MIAEYIALVGATLILVRGSIFGWLRAWKPVSGLLHCAQCTGFWVGLVGMAILSPRTGTKLYEVHYVECILAGFGVSVLALLADALILHMLGDPEDKSPPL